MVKYEDMAIRLSVSGAIILDASAFQISGVIAGCGIVIPTPKKKVPCVECKQLMDSPADPSIPPFCERCRNSRPIIIVQGDYIERKVVVQDSVLNRSEVK